MAGKKIGLVLALDGEREFVQAVTNAKKEADAFKAALKALAEEFDGNANSMEYLQKKQELLEQQQASYNRRLDAAKTGLNQARDTYKKQADAVEELGRKTEEARKALEEFEKNGDTSSDAYKDQKNQLDKLNDAYDKQTSNLQKAEGRISDWNKRIAQANTDVSKINREINQNSQYLNEASSSADKCATSIDQYGKEIKDAADNTKEMESTSDSATKVVTGLGEKFQTAFITTGVALAVDAVKELAGAVTELAPELDAASKQFQAATGTAAESMGEYQDTIQEVYKSGMGEGFSDIAEVMATITQNMGEMDPGSLQEITEYAITLRDTFDMDVNESIRGANALMESMGLTAEQAFDYIAKGAQNGLDRSQELADNLAEYSQLWAQAGFSAEEMFSILDNGLNSGAYNLDKVNDYVKEFGISLSDGRMEEHLESFSEQTQSLFAAWKNGEATTKDVFYSVIADLSNMTSEQEALTLASEMWSAVGEDNSLKVIKSLDDVNTKYQNVTGSAQALTEVKYSDIGTAFESLGKTIETKFLDPIADKALPAITDVVNGITEAMDPPKTLMQEFSEEIENANKNLEKTVENAEKTVENAELEAGKVGELGSQLLELNSVEEKSLAQRYQLREVVAQLGEYIPEVAAAYDAETDSVNLTNGEIEKLIQNTQDLMIEQAKQAAGQEVVNSLLEAQMQLDNAKEMAAAQKELLTTYVEGQEALQNLDMAMKSGGMSADEYNKKLQEIAETTGISVSDIESMGQTLGYQYNETSAALDDTNQSIADLEENISNGEKQLESMNQAAKNLGESMDGAKAPMTEAAEATQKFGEGAMSAISPSTALVESTKELGEQAEETAGTVGEANEEMASSADQYAEAQKNALEQVREAYGELKDAISDNIQSSISLMEEFDGGENISTDQILENLKSQREGIEEWGEDMQYLAEHIGENFTPEMFDELMELGPEAKEMVGNLAENLRQGGENFDEIVKEWGLLDGLEEELSDRFAAIQLAYDAGIEGIGESTEEDFQNLSDTIQKAVEESVEGWDGLEEGTVEKLDAAISAARNAGVQIPEGLTEGIQSGEISADQALDSLNGALQGQFDGLVEIAKERGIEIPEGLQAGIDEGGPAAEQAILDLLQLLANASASEQGKETGKTYTSGQADGMTENAGEVEAAAENVASQAAEAAEGQAGEFNEAGGTLIGSLGDGMTGNQSAAVSAAMGAAQAAANATSANRSGFENAGLNLILGMAQGIAQGSEAVQEAARNVVRQAEAAANKEGGNASPSKKWRKEVGLNLSKGTALGISDGKEEVRKASADMAKAALQGAQAEAEIQSPSKKFKRAVGEQIGKGTAMGIKGATQEAVKASEEMSDKVYKKASSWLSKYKKNHEITLDDEKYFWQQIKGIANTGSDAYEKATAKIAKIRKEEQKQQEQAEKDQDKRENNRFAKQINRNFGVSRYETTGSGKNKKTTKKSDEDYFSEIYSEANQYLGNMEVLYDVSLDQQEKYWSKLVRSIQKNGGKYTQAWYDAKEQLKKIREEQKKEEAQTYDDMLSEAETYVEHKRILNKMSDNQELAFWEKKLKELEKSGGKYTDAWYEIYEKIKGLEEDIAQAAADAEEAEQERLEELKRQEEEALSTRASAQDKILSNYKTYYKVSEQAEVDYWDIARHQFAVGTQERIDADQKYFDAKQALYDKLEDLDKEYADNVKEVNEQLKEDIEDLTQEYEDAVNDRAEAIKSSFGLFDEFYSESESGQKLLENLQSQVEGIAAWEKELNLLGARGISEGLLEELQEMGPEAAASIKALNSLTAEELAEYDKLWNQRNELAQSQAIKENEPLRHETEEKIEQLKEDADDQIQELTKAYEQSIAEAMEGISSDLKKLANQAYDATEDAIAEMVSSIGGEYTAAPVKEHTKVVVEEISSELGKLPEQGKIIGDDTLTAMMGALGDDEEIIEQVHTLYEKLRIAFEQESQGLSDAYAGFVISGLKSSLAGMTELNQTIDASTNRTVNVNMDMGGLESKIDRLIALSEEYLPYLSEGTVINMDGEKVAEQQFPRLSRMLAQSSKLKR